MSSNDSPKIRRARPLFARCVGMMAKSSVSAKFPALPSLCARGRHGRRRSSETLYQLPLFDFEQTYLSARDSTDDVDEPN